MLAKWTGVLSNVAVTNDRNEMSLETNPHYFMWEGLYPGGSSGLAFHLPPPHGVCLILDKPIC